MPELKEKISLGLDELRTLVLGAQVLLIFQFQAALQESFGRLPRSTQLLHLGGLALVLVALCFLLGPMTRHRLVERGHVGVALERYLSQLTGLALVPFALAFGIAVAVPTVKVLGTEAGFVAGMVTTLGALLLWFRPDAARRKTPEDDVTTGDIQGHGPDIAEQPLPDKIDQVLTEARIVLPGAQALLGFQFVAMLMTGFDDLPRSSQLLHLGSLGLVALTTILLMAPAAYHRVVERGAASESFHRYASRLLLLAMVPLLVGLCGDWYVIARHVTHSYGFALGTSLALLGAVTALWFGYPLMLRSRPGSNLAANRHRIASSKG